jgi:transcriptional regulator with XRE-family HTH domain
MDGPEVTRLRLQAGLTRQELATRVGISRTRIDKIEAGLAGGVGVPTARSLARVLGCAYEDIAQVVEKAS